MSSYTKVTDRLDQVVEVLSRAITAAFLAVVTVGLLCLMGLVIAGTFAILHNGNDFGDVGGGGGGGGDVIVLPGVR
jgi:predicted lysophospholipase L1 biosynthesis ABC-type transport system permease subunit